MDPSDPFVRALAAAGDVDLDHVASPARKWLRRALVYVPGVLWVMVGHALLIATVLQPAGSSLTLAGAVMVFSMLVTFRPLLRLTLWAAEHIEPVRIAELRYRHNLGRWTVRLLGLFGPPDINGLAQQDPDGLFQVIARDWTPTWTRPARPSWTHLVALGLTAAIVVELLPLLSNELAAATTSD